MKDETIRPIAEEIYRVRKELKFPDEPDTDWYMAEYYLANESFREVEDYARDIFNVYDGKPGANSY